MRLIDRVRLLAGLDADFYIPELKSVAGCRPRGFLEEKLLPLRENILERLVVGRLLALRPDDVAVPHLAQMSVSLARFIPNAAGGVARHLDPNSPATDPENRVASFQEAAGANRRPNERMAAEVARFEGRLRDLGFLLASR